MGAAINRPMAPNEEWALDDAAIRVLREAGLIDGGEDQTMKGRSWIKNRAIGDAIGELFYGPDKNPFKNATDLE